MEHLTVSDLEDLIVLTEEKMIGLREDQAGYQEQADLVGKLREMRLAKMQEEA